LQVPTTTVDASALETAKKATKRRPINFDMRTILILSIMLYPQIVISTSVPIFRVLRFCSMCRTAPEEG
jgi:hypothetical protein